MDLTPSTDEHVSRPTTLVEKLTTIRQMLETLDTLTHAGQRHLMSKVVAFVGGQVDRAIHHASPGNDHILREELTLLKRESDRQLPSVPVFGARAESLIGLLALAA
jgi:hypothetical protein